MIRNSNPKNIHDRNTNTIASADGVGIRSTPRTNAFSTTKDWHIKLRL